MCIIPIIVIVKLRRNLWRWCFSKAYPVAALKIVSALYLKNCRLRSTLYLLTSSLTM